MGERLRIGVSACLLGAQVRFDGGHRRDDGVVALGEVFELVPVCPELELGLGTPRPSLRLQARGLGTALVERGGRDLSGPMRELARRRVGELRALGLSGFVGKAGSPSCGRERVRVYDEAGVAQKRGQGLFTATLMAEWPRLPVEEEGRLRNPDLREAFLVRVFAFDALERLFAGAWRPRDLVDFHARAKMLLLAWSPAIYRELGRLVAQAGSADRAALADAYTDRFLAAFAGATTRGRHANALEHMVGHLRDRLGPVERAELHELTEDYRLGRVSRAAAVALLRHHVRAQGLGYLAAQSYLAPYPRELQEDRR
jgi:uncharacterized protein YbgA (DUF1722 family)/uncharacterized protein YbbK (DUF523 family)